MAASVRLEVTLGADPIGRIAPFRHDNRRHLYVLDRPVDFRGEMEVLRITGTGDASYRLEHVVLLGERPEPTCYRPRIERLTARLRRNQDGSFTVAVDATTWPAARCSVEVTRADTGQPVAEAHEKDSLSLALDRRGRRAGAAGGRVSGVCPGDRGGGTRGDRGRGRDRRVRRRNRSDHRARGSVQPRRRPTGTPAHHLRGAGAARPRDGSRRRTLGRAGARPHPFSAGRTPSGRTGRRAGCWSTDRCRERSPRVRHSPAP